MSHLAKTLLVAGALSVAACGGGSGAGEGPLGGPQETSPAAVRLEITAPKPGAELTGATIGVTGVLLGGAEGDAKEVVVNGVTASVAADGSFAVELAPEFGITHVLVEGRSGDSAALERRLDVMWAPEYLAPAAGTSRFELNDALMLRLGQRLFDTHLRGSDLDLGATPVVAKDLASIVELLLRSADLASLLDGSIVVGGGGASLTIDLTRVDLGSVRTDLEIVRDPTNGEMGIDLFIDLDDAFLGMNGQFTFESETLRILGGLRADLRAYARLTLARRADGTVDVGITGARAEVSGAIRPMFENPEGGQDGDELNGFFGVVGSSFSGLIDDLLTARLIPTFTDALPALFQNLLGQIGGLLAQRTVELDSGLGHPVKLLLDGRIAAIDVVPGPPSGSLTPPGHVTVRVGATVDAEGDSVHPDSRGAPRAVAEANAPFSNAGGLQLALRQDFVNALLHTLWSHGMLDGDLQAGGAAAKVRAVLPPVIRAAPIDTACRVGADRCDVVLQIGQLEVDAFEQRYGIHATVGAVVRVADGRVSLALQETPDFVVWNLSPVPSTVFTPAFVGQVLTTTVWPALGGAIGTDLGFPLPLPNLADLGLGELAPSLAQSSLELLMRRRLSVASGYLGMAADLELWTAPPR